MPKSTISLDIEKAVPAKKAEAAPLKFTNSAFSLGADPELFIINADGVYVSPDMIPGTKDKPHKVEYGAVQRDGMAAEYNIEPCKTFEEWNRNHKAVQGQLQAMLPSGYKLVATTSVRFSPEVFDAAPEDAKQLGCQPDWNAWTAELNPPPKLPDDPYLRCLGGHIHGGWDKDLDTTDIQHMMNCFDLTKQLDWFLGAWALKHDKDVERRKLYGKAGACRIKPYGVEYRVLSSFWVQEKELRLEVWNRCVKAIETMSGTYLPDIYLHLNGGIQQGINSGKMNPTIARDCKYPLQNIEKGLF